MMRASIVFSVILAHSFVTQAQEHRPGDDRPNVLFILTDDQGYSTLSCYGNQRVSTPHLDALAQTGIRFTSAYVMPQCTQTRAALLSGMHSARSRMWHVIPFYASPWAPVAEPVYCEELPSELSRLPRAFQQAGYATGMAGKWHLTGPEYGDYVSLKAAAGPDFGFDEVSSRGPGSHNEGDKWVDYLTDEAIAFANRHRDQPWFFYLSHHTLHGRVSAPEKLIAKYRQLGAPETGLHNATYLAAIEHLDQSIGRLMHGLEASGQRDKTLVVFLSDNGGVDTTWLLPNWVQPDHTTAVVDGTRPLAVKHQEFDNAPLRGTKGSAYEGGIRVPCIVSWPQKILTPGVDDTPIHVVDWLPTLLSAAGINPPAQSDGQDLGPLFSGQKLASRPLFWYLPLYELRWAMTPCAVIREGDWKLIEWFGDRFDDQHSSGPLYRPGHHLELFNLAEDISESHNQAHAHPEKVAALHAHLRSWIAEMDVPVPAANPQFDASKAFTETKNKADLPTQ